MQPSCPIQTPPCRRERPLEALRQLVAALAAHLPGGEHAVRGVALSDLDVSTLVDIGAAPEIIARAELRDAWARAPRVDPTRHL
jgi:hypothetical protein